MILASCMLFVANLVRRPLSSGTLSQTGSLPPVWVLDPSGSASFDILASQSNGLAPLLTSPDDIALHIGAGVWQIIPFGAASFRILSSVSIPSVPVVSTTDGASISIGA